jgi:hypothetical protein
LSEKTRVFLVRALAPELGLEPALVPEPELVPALELALEQPEPPEQVPGLELLQLAAEPVPGLVPALGLAQEPVLEQALAQALLVQVQAPGQVQVPAGHASLVGPDSRPKRLPTILPPGILTIFWVFYRLSF